MKKSIVFLLLLALLLSSCQNHSQNDNQIPDSTDENTIPAIDKYIELPRYPADTISFQLDKPGVYAQYKKYIEEHPYPDYYPKPEQFSSLGTLVYVGMWENIFKENTYRASLGYYEYEYTVPETGQKKLYTVNFMPLGEGNGYSFDDPEIRHEYFLFKEAELKRYNSAWFEDGDFTKYIGKDHIYCLVNDELLLYLWSDAPINGHPVERRLGLVYFIHNDIVYKIRINEGADSEIANDIVRRLTHIDTYKQAIKDLMNPANALPKNE